MRHEFIDRYSRIDSRVHRINIVIKFLFTVLVIIATIVSPISLLTLFTAVFLIIVAVMSKIPLVFIIRRLMLLEILVIGIALLALLQPNGGLIFMKMIIKSTLCLFTIILLSNTTPFSDILNLLRRAKFPSWFVTILALMYRYIFVLIDEAERMTRARKSRSLTNNRMEIWKNLGTVIGELFVRSTERAERIYSAMCSRGWK